MSTELPTTDSQSTVRDERPYSRVRLVLGIIGRMWVWFLAGCLVITLVPVLFGWRPYLIESASMAPRINVGDVVIASPEQDPQVLLGRVAVFTDPDRPDRNKTHRVVRIADDGTLVTKGDANPTEDSAHATVAEVHGLGRLLVKFVGLPVIWVRTGQWLWVLLFLVGTAFAVRWVGRDHEDQDRGSPPDDGDDLPQARTQAGPLYRSGVDIAASRTGPLARSGALRWAVRAGYAGALAGVLVVPTSVAAFSATTRNAASSWQAATAQYTDVIQSMNPWLYWKLDERRNAGSAQDSSGNGRDGEYSPDGGTTYFTKRITGALADAPNWAITLRQDTSCVYSEDSAETTGPGAFTEIVWFKAAPGYDQGGKLIGFERPRTGVDAPSTGQYDRMLYLDGNARLWFGVYNGGYRLLSTAAAWDDGQWHMAVGTMGSAGMALYVDGQLVDSNSNSVAEANASGWWRVGCGNLAGWASGWSGPNGPPGDSTPTNYSFQGSLDEAAIWTKALTASDIAYLYFAR